MYFSPSEAKSAAHQDHLGMQALIPSIQIDDIEFPPKIRSQTSAHMVLRGTLKNRAQVVYFKKVAVENAIFESLFSAMLRLYLDDFAALTILVKNNQGIIIGVASYELAGFKTYKEITEITQTQFAAKLATKISEPHPNANFNATTIMTTPSTAFRIQRPTKGKNSRELEIKNLAALMKLKKQIFGVKGDEFPFQFKNPTGLIAISLLAYLFANDDMHRKNFGVHQVYDLALITVPENFSREDIIAIANQHYLIKNLAPSDTNKNIINDSIVQPTDNEAREQKQEKADDDRRNQTIAVKNPVIIKQDTHVFVYYKNSSRADCLVKLDHRAIIALQSKNLAFPEIGTPKFIGKISLPPEIIASLGDEIIQNDFIENHAKWVWGCIDHDKCYVSSITEITRLFHNAKLALSSINPKFLKIFPNCQGMEDEMLHYFMTNITPENSWIAGIPIGNACENRFTENDKNLGNSLASNEEAINEKYETYVRILITPCSITTDRLIEAAAELLHDNDHIRRLKNDFCFRMFSNEKAVLQDEAFCGWLKKNFGKINKIKTIVCEKIFALLPKEDKNIDAYIKSAANKAQHLIEGNFNLRPSSKIDAYLTNADQIDINIRYLLEFLCQDLLFSIEQLKNYPEFQNLHKESLKVLCQEMVDNKEINLDNLYLRFRARIQAVCNDIGSYLDIQKMHLAHKEKIIKSTVIVTFMILMATFLVMITAIPLSINLIVISACVAMCINIIINIGRFYLGTYAKNDQIAKLASTQDQNKDTSPPSSSPEILKDGSKRKTPMALCTPSCSRSTFPSSRSMPNTILPSKLKPESPLGTPPPEEEKNSSPQNRPIIFGPLQLSSPKAAKPKNDLADNKGTLFNSTKKLSKKHKTKKPGTTFPHSGKGWQPKKIGAPC